MKNYEEQFKEETGQDAYQANNMRPQIPEDYYVEYLKERLTESEKKKEYFRKQCLLLKKTTNETI